MQAAIDQCVPEKCMRNNAKIYKCTRWYPAALRRAISRKRCLWRLKRESPDNTDVLAVYREAEHKCNNTGTFFNFINNNLSCKRGLGALNNDNGDLITMTAIALTY